MRYVRNIYKYYVAYKLIEEADAAKRAVGAAAPTKPAPTDADAPPQLTTQAPVVFLCTGVRHFVTVHLELHDDPTRP